MYHYRLNHFFVDDTISYPSIQNLKTGATINTQVLKDIALVLPVLEQHKLLFAEKVILVARKTHLFKDIEILINKENIISKLSFLLDNNEDGCISIRIQGYGLLKKRFEAEEKVENLVNLDIRLDQRDIGLNIDVTNWLPLIVERKDGVTYYKWHLDRFNGNKGRLEAALLEIEAATGMQQEYSTSFDRGEYDDGYVTQGRSIYVSRHIFEEAFENQPFSIDVDITDYLAPKEALDFFDEKIMPKIAALETLTKSRPLLAREQLELESLQSILAARDIAEIDAILAKISNMPTDAELRKRLIAQAEAKRDLIVDNNI
jgi:hypothetical protein